MNALGIVIIGRNEGERLRRCLGSVLGRGEAVVYVDSGSTDDSAALAGAMGAEVVELDTDQPFTAARGRNAGLERLLEVLPDAALVQFVDGDCEVAADWWGQARRTLANRPEVAAVCGRRRERFPEASVYNRLCDIEWTTPIGEAAACGGDAMMRLQAVRQAGGFDPAVIAAEDDELCVRLRQHGWRIERIDAEMTLHDAAMTRAGQWYKRMTRAGHGFAQVREKHRGASIEHFVRESRGVWVWGGAAPLTILAAGTLTGGWGLVLGGVYGWSAWRVYRHMRGRGFSRRDARLYAAHCTLAKFPQLVGQVKYWTRRLGRRRTTIIEYKPSGPRKKPT